MKGLELSEKYFEEYGRPMLEKEFPDILPYLAVGLFGSGSECFGYDDEVSRDHDFEPGFCIFLPDESVIDRRTAFRLERAYTKLPKEFMGIKREMLAPVGGMRHGVIRTADFFNDKVGASDGNLTMEAWLTLPEHYLAEAVNGKIFFDNYGEVARIREQLSRYPATTTLSRDSAYFCRTNPLSTGGRHFSSRGLTQSSRRNSWALSVRCWHRWEACVTVL